MIVPRYYEDLEILHENTMPARAYYIPASVRMDDLVEHREHSDRILFLNGMWKFKYFESIYDVTEEFYKVGFDSFDYDETIVPGVWQMQGYDYHQYTNVKYPFPFDPPYVPQDNPCGAYIYNFRYKRDENANKAFLNFEGVDSCFYLWLNGTYVGYSQVSHMTSEFDVTSLINDGENTLAVLVLKWCDGSYLEDQDKFRMSGIFRDVYIINRPQKCIWDYSISTEVTDKKATVKMSASFTKYTKIKVTMEDCDGSKVAVGEVISNDDLPDNGELKLIVDNPIFWNAENPYLYTLILESEYETIVEYVGFRTIEIIDRVIYFNGEKIKFRGVNRHDSDPVTGPAVNINQILTDLSLMKQHNINSIRCSHYPNAPYFYQLCDKYGFMVIDEADIEAHGPLLIYRKEDTFENRARLWNESIADNPDWNKSIVDRVKLMVQRDKNRPCVVMWSMGNEAAYGCNFEAALKWTKNYDSSRITQYESSRYRNYDITYNYDNLDLYSRMYPSPEEIKEYLKNDASKPFLLVEYCHSMGNGPGDFEEYFQIIQKNDLMCGGFVWEWCDHAINKGQTEDGKTIFYYGGDHGETVHDVNFCVDGMVFPNRRPHTGLLEYKNVYRPARVVSYDGENGNLVIWNYMDFDDLANYVNICYELSCDGDVTDSGKINVDSIPPHSKGVVKLNLKVPEKGRVFLKVFYKLKKKMDLIPPNHLLGFDEIAIENADSRNQNVLKILEEKEEYGKLEISENDRSVVINGNKFTYVYNKKNGMFESILFGGKEYFDRPMELNIWRAPTDNDINIKNEWKKACYDSAYARAYETKIYKMKDFVCIETKAAMVADTVQRILDIDMTWKIYGDGRISASMDVVKNNEFPEMPRFGVRLFLNKSFENISYFGMGPHESYRDKHRSTSHGLYNAKVEELHEDYIKPQENGSHFDCDFVKLYDSKHVLFVTSEKTFSFNASVYTQEILMSTAHNYELIKSGSTVLCVDYSLNGIGSNSCGPEVLDKYKFNETKFMFEFDAIPCEM